MGKKTALLALTSAAFSCLLLGGCQKRGLDEFAAKLQELPPDLAATLDPKTLATKVTTSHPQPVKPAVLPVAPCCGSTDTKSLKVNFTYTKCGLLRDFIVAPLGDAVFFDPGQGGGGGQSGKPGGVKAYRRGELNRTSVLDSTVCFTSDGPWDATLIEDRHCIGYEPQDTLIINPFGKVVTFVWNGGPSNHPPQVHLVSCREVGLVRFPCGGLSDCPCASEPCPAEQPCDCGLQGQW